MKANIFQKYKLIDNKHDTLFLVRKICKPTEQGFDSPRVIISLSSCTRLGQMNLHLMGNKSQSSWLLGKTFYQSRLQSKPN